MVLPVDEGAAGTESQVPEQIPWPKDISKPLAASARFVQEERRDSVPLLRGEGALGAVERDRAPAPARTASKPGPSSRDAAQASRKPVPRQTPLRRPLAGASPRGSRQAGGPASRTLVGVGAGRTSLGAGIWCVVGDVSPLPGVDVRTRFAYYDVPGRTPDEISGSMAKLISAGAAGAHQAAGTARQEVSASFDLIAQGSLCRAQRVGVELDTVITLPRLREGVTIALQQRWSRFEQAISSHENSHKAIAVRVANDLRQELDSAAERGGTCSEMSAAFTAAQQRAHAQMQRRQSEYDAYTSSHCGSTL